MHGNLEKQFLLEVIRRKRNKSWKNKILKKLRFYYSNLKRIKYSYIFGLTLLFFALLYQNNLVSNPTDILVTKLVHNPRPPISTSPWSWENKQQIHPLIANIGKNEEKSIKSVAKYIALNEPDPYLRIKAIHDYVISRVDYDLSVLQTGVRPSQKPQAVFKTHKAVCEGYARLFQAIGREMGEEIVYVRGKIRQELVPDDLIPTFFRIGKSKVNWTLHAWNAVKIGDSWQLVDTTWDDNKQNKYSSDYLMLPPEAMISSHFPDISDWQLLTKAKNYKEFENSPILQPQFFAQSLTLVSPQKYKTKVGKRASIIIDTPDDYQQEIMAFAKPVAREKFLSWNFFKPKSDTSKNNSIKCKNMGQKPLEISCNFSETGKYEVFMFAKKSKLTALGKLKFQTKF